MGYMQIILHDINLNDLQSMNLLHIHSDDFIIAMSNVIVVPSV